MAISRKRIVQLMQVMELDAVYPKRKLTQPRVDV